MGQVYGRMHLYVTLLISLGGLLVVGGCDDSDRFKLPEGAVRKKVRQSARHSFRVKGKVRIPSHRSLPLWTEMALQPDNHVFRSELVRLQGQRWSREGGSHLFDFYFQQSNHMAARTLSQVANRMAFFVSRWTARPFKKRIAVVLAPWKKDSPSNWTQNVRKATTQPSTQPTSQPIRHKVRSRNIPDVGTLRIVLYTGTKNQPVYSRFGLISTLLERTMQLVLTQKAHDVPVQLWRSIGFPLYFATRGNGAMASRVFDRSIASTFRDRLERMGRPNVQDAQRMLKLYRSQKLAPLLYPHARNILISFLGFIEDAYGHGVLAALLRDMLQHPQWSFDKHVLRVLGQTETYLWNKWFVHYYTDQWKRVVQGLDPLKTIQPLSSPKRTQ